MIYYVESCWNQASCPVPDVFFDRIAVIDNGLLHKSSKGGGDLPDKICMVVFDVSAIL